MKNSKENQTIILIGAFCGGMLVGIFTEFIVTRRIMKAAKKTSTLAKLIQESLEFIVEHDGEITDEAMRDALNERLEFIEIVANES